MEVRNKREIKQSKRVIQQNRPSTAGVFHPTIMLNPMREHDVAQLGKRTELNSWAVCEIYFKKSEERKEKNQWILIISPSGSSTSSVLQCAHGGVSSTVRHQSGLSHIRHGKCSLVNL
jgi:hypothetical protein